MAADAGRGFATATDLADWLVRVLGMPFRQAHHVTGALVKIAEDQNCDLADLALSDMQAVESGITEDIYSVLSVESALAGRTSFGGAAPGNVAEAAVEARKRFLDGA